MKDNEFFVTSLSHRSIVKFVTILNLCQFLTEKIEIHSHAIPAQLWRFIDDYEYKHYFSEQSYVCCSENNPLFVARIYGSAIQAQITRNFLRFNSDPRTRVHVTKEPFDFLVLQMALELNDTHRLMKFIQRNGISS